MRGLFLSDGAVSQRKSTGVNVKQGEIRILGAVKSLDFLDLALLERCKTFKQALAVSQGMARTNASDTSIADAIGRDPSVWSRIKNKPKERPAFMPEDQYAALCNALGNRGVVQWLALQVGCRLAPIEESRADRLRRELAEIESQERVA